MTTITRPATELAQHPTRRHLVRQSAGALRATTQRLKSAIAELAVGGQLGPDPEVEVGRWTGART
jgi:hypothetical protein